MSSDPSKSQDYDLPANSEGITKSAVQQNVVDLLRAAQEGNVDEVVGMISSGKAAVDDCDGLGRSCLHFAASNGHVHLIRALVEHHASVDKKDNHSHTPLMMACMSNQPEAARVLVECGADVNAQSSVSETDVLYLAGSFLDLDTLRFLVERGARIQAKGNPVAESPLFRAVRQQDEEMLDLLLEAGADPNAVDTHMLTPLIMAVGCGSLPLLEKLHSRGARLDSRIRGGGTALHIAAGTGAEEVIQWLVDHGSSFLMDNDGATPADVARSGTPILLGMRVHPDNEETAQQFLDRVKKANAFKEQGNAAVHAGKYQEAISAYTEALDICPEHTACLGNRALCLSNLGDHVTALKDCDRCLEMNPMWPKAYLRKVTALIGLSKHEAARDLLKQGFSLCGKDDEVLLAAVRKLSEAMK